MTEETMNREIKFRARNKKTGKWFYWAVENSFMEGWETYIKDFEIDWFTFGCFVGLNDKNDKEIYEGDICNDGSMVQFVGGRYLLIYKDGKHEDLIGDEDEIIGNIYENKELLK